MESAVISQVSPARARSIAGDHWKEALALALLLGVAAAVEARGLRAGPNYDEGVYLASVDALRHGGRLAVDVFTSQPPGFYVLLQAIAGLVGSSVNPMRIGFEAVALVGVLGAWLLGRQLSGPAGGLLTAGVYAAAPALAAGATVVAADEASVAAAVLALAAYAVATRRDSSAAAVIAGVLATTAISIKLFAPPLLLGVVGLALVGDRRLRRFAHAGAGALAAAAVLCVAYARDLGSIWSDAVAFQVRSGANIAANWHMLRGTVDAHTPFTYLVAGGVAAAFVAGRNRETFGLWLATPACAVFLLTRPTVLEHHRVLLAAALALAAGVSLGRLPTRFVAVPVALVVAAGLAQQWIRLGRSAPTPSYQTWAAAQLRSRTAPGELVATDMPIVAHLAGRDLPGELVDTSYARFIAGSLTNRDVIRVLEHDHVRVVVAGRTFYARPELRRWIEAHYSQVAGRPGAVIYVRSPHSER